MKSIAPQIANFLRSLEQRNMSPATIRAYGIDLNEFAKYLSRKTMRSISDIDRDTIRGYLVWLKERNLKPNSYLRKLAAIRSFFKNLMRTEEIAKNPCLGLGIPRRPVKIPKFLTKDELERVIAAICRTRDQLGSLRNRAWIELVYSCGVRVSEAAGLNIGDIDFWNKTITVIGKGNKERIVPIGSIGLKAVREYLKARGDDFMSPASAKKPLFLNLRAKSRLSTRGMHQLIDQAARRANLGRKISPHVVRHTFATHLLDAGCDLRSVQEMLGHKNLSTTQIYAHVTTERMKKIYEKAHPRA